MQFMAIAIRLVGVWLGRAWRRGPWRVVLVAVGLSHRMIQTTARVLRRQSAVCAVHCSVLLVSDCLPAGWMDCFSDLRVHEFEPYHWRWKVYPRLGISSPFWSSSEGSFSWLDQVAYCTCVSDANLSVLSGSEGSCIRLMVPIVMHILGKHSNDDWFATSIPKNEDYCVPLLLRTLLMAFNKKHGIIFYSTHAPCNLCNFVNNNHKSCQRRAVKEIKNVY